MSEKTQPPTQIIKLVKIKSWYIPGDSASYSLLKTLGVPLLKIHADFMPTIEFQAKPKGIRASISTFTDVRNEMLDALGSKWKSKEGRLCRLDDARLQFSASVTDSNRKAISQIEAILHKFFGRWGHKCHANFSETTTKLKLVVDYKFDPHCNPIIPNDDPAPKTDMQLIIGFTKIKLSFHNPAKEAKDRRMAPPVTLFEVFTKTGSEWGAVHTSTFTDSEIGDPTEFLGAMSILFTRRRVLVP